ncbi:hypothetical protein FHS18_000776 [Paenibacillus phyllosphaerae]|uniref:Glycosyltransferase RgtA/B/C/D-like domain-containing protein n=1 Tax=Paenibacillus phyllosphaerae TaxID=274593 RepID=A0A7W5FL62_9BACL|nr:hypothetical protein [Paenibacillus phyllosphaerae]MBB3108748.1 hypothetical protein [Paenibacillus phyllosphaerae]
MNYASLSNQLYAMAHYLFAFAVLYLVLPRFFLKGAEGGREDRFVNVTARLCKAATIYIVLVYLLTLLQLYEFMAFTAVLLLIATWQLWKRGSQRARAEAAHALNLRFYALLEKPAWMQGPYWPRLTRKWRPKQWRSSIKQARGAWAAALLLAAVILISAYMRFYDAFHSAAPAMSDGAVTLAWMKYINARILFHDGIYPQGYYITLSLLSKFAAIDPLYILKYNGPLSSTLTLVGLYLILSRMTGSQIAGIAGAAVYGFGGEAVFGGDWERQAASNSQEYAYIYLYPSLLFMLRYLQRGSRLELWAAAGALTTAGLIHSLAFAYAGMGLGVALISAALTPEVRSWRRIGLLAVVGIGTVIVSYAPVQLALWSGVGLNESAADFLISRTEAALPELHLMDHIALAGIAVTIISGLINWRRREYRLMEWFAIGFGTASFLLYYIVPYITKSTVLAARTQSLWSLGLCFTTGFAWWSLWRLLSRIRWRSFVEFPVAIAAFAALALYAQLSPIVAYKMDWESVFRQYLRIASLHPAKTWTIFSQEEGYSLVYGMGWHQYVRNLVTEYDPAKTPLTRYGQSEYDADATPHIYIFDEKEVFRVSKASSIYESLEQNRYIKHEEDIVLLAKWLAAYKTAHGLPELFYEDEHLRIWHIEQPQPEDEENRRIWGTPS